MVRINQPQKKRRPRTCVGCGAESAKRELMRIVRTPEGVVRFDATGKANGRGAYVCAAAECIAAAKKKKALERALKSEIPDTLYDELLAVCCSE
ncbi:MAG: YlxR family protein [Synergistes sp.]|nr:YlxR family protein [Synergistes sp.]